MANKKITDLPIISAPLKGTDLWEVSIDDGASFSSHQATGDELKALLSLGGDQYTFVKADGVTPSVNGQQFLDGYITAIDKLVNTETPQTLILAPGTYLLSQDFNIPDGLSIVSLTGERDAVIAMDGYIFMIQDGTTKLKGLNLAGNVFYNDYGTTGCVIDNCTINSFIAWTQNVPFYGTIKNSYLNEIYAPFSGTMLNIEYCGTVYTDNATGYSLYLYPLLDGVNLNNTFYCDGSYDILFAPTILNCSGRFFDQVDITTVLGDATFKNITSFSMSGCSISGDILLENCVGGQRVFEGIAFSDIFDADINLKVIDCHQTYDDGGFLISHNDFSFESVNIEFRDCTARGNAFNFNYTNTSINDYNVLVDNCNVAVGTANCFNHIIEDSAVITVNNITFRDCTTDASNSFNTTNNNTGNLFIYNQNFINCTAGVSSFLYVSGFNGMDFRVYDVSFEGCTATDNSFIRLGYITYSQIDRININNCTSGDYSFISTNDDSSGFTLESSSSDNCFISNCTAGNNSFLNFITQGNVNIDSSSVFNISNCTAGNNSFYYIEDIAQTGGHFMYIDARFNNCTASNNSFGSISSKFGSCSIIHHEKTTYTHCTGRNYSFMGEVNSTLTNCIARDNSFGSVYKYENMNGSAAGTFENCTGNAICFAGSDNNTATNQPTATGVFKYCTASSLSFGSYINDGVNINTTATGTFQWCDTGRRPFGTEFGSGLIGGGYLFWCQTNDKSSSVNWSGQKYNI